MSILTQDNKIQIQPAVRAANQIKRNTARLAESIKRDWEQSYDLLWHNPRATPEEVLAELGTDAAELFELSAQTVAYMLSILTGVMDDEVARIQAKIAEKPETVTHDDGTVTLA